MDLSAVATPISAPTPDRILYRPRLFRLLDELMTKPLLWMAGGPGAGKTTLIASYLAEREIRATWYRGRGVSRDTLQALLRGLPPHGVLILDDCGELGAESVLHSFLIESAQEIPRDSRVVLIGRGAPPGVYARSIANGLIAVLPGHELPFTLEEVRALARASSIDEQAADALHRRCSGWVAGVAIGLQSFRQHPANAERADCELRSGAFAYFASEVFERLTPRERQVLVSTAVLSRLTAQQAEALSGTHGAWPILRRFASHHQLLLQEPSAHGTLEYVPLFREFLLAHLEDSLPAGELRALATRASALFEACPTLTWLAGCDLLRAWTSLRRGDHEDCHRLLRDALTTARAASYPSPTCLILPAVAAELCNEALSADVAAESARSLIQRYRLAAPPNAAREWPWCFMVYVLGRFRLLKAGEPIRFAGRTQRKPFELLQALIAFGGTEVGAGTLTDALWPDSDGDAGYHALESALYRLRQLLGAPDAVRMVGGKLSLDRRQFWVDMWELERELHSGNRSDADTAARLGRARRLYEGHFLEREGEKPWVLKTRQALRDRVLRCVRDAARSHESRRSWHEAVRVYQGGLELDSLAEDLYRGLMICYRELGDHSEALQVYRRCRELLNRFLGLAPSAKTQAIYQSVMQSAASSAGPCSDLSASRYGGLASVSVP